MTVAKNNSNDASPEPAEAAPALSVGEAAWLAKIAETFADEWADDLSARLSQPVQIAPIALGAATANELAHCHQQFWTLLVADNRNAPVRLELPLPWAHRAVDCLLGAIEPTQTPGKPLTSIERRLLRRIVASAAAALGVALGPQAPLQVKLNDSTEDDEPGPTMATLVANFATDIDDGESQLRLWLPKQLVTIASEAPAASQPQQSADEGLSEQTVDFSVVAPPTSLPADQLAELAPGDVLVTDADAGSQVIVRLDGKDAFIAQLGSRNGKRAVTLSKKLSKKIEE